MQKKYLFIDRDGTLIVEPDDKQIDSLEKLQLLPHVIPSLLRLTAAGFSLIMVSNQDGLGTASLPQENFLPPHQKMLDIFSSQDINFDAIHICPHFAEDACECRKPKVGLLLEYLKQQTIDRENSYVIGDRQTDAQLAENIGIKSILLTVPEFSNWLKITDYLLNNPRTAQVTRKTKETNITAKVNLDSVEPIEINTGIGFFDHMLEQLAKHGGFSLALTVQGDLHIDDHHTVEDTALTLGQALKKALGDKRGIERYGFLLPMDEARVQVALDLSGRAYCQFNGTFNRESVGELSTELVKHFFHSFADALGATLHIDVQGENAHHMIEAVFKGVARTLRQAFAKTSDSLPSTKGVL